MSRLRIGLEQIQCVGHVCPLCGVLNSEHTTGRASYHYVKSAPWIWPPRIVHECPEPTCSALWEPEEYAALCRKRLDKPDHV